jgi:predicted short-subunit dehydrogenase-like oxidoreductase (DUF2520 family)
LYISGKIGMGKATITVVGSGRVAEALTVALYGTGHKIVSVISRNLTTARALAEKVNSTATQSMRISAETNLLLLAVPDSAIGEVAKGLITDPSTIVVHTSGSTGTDVFPPAIRHYGVIYPLQTFTSGRQVGMADIHFFTEASDARSHELIDKVVSSVGRNIHHLDTERRRVLHLSAVFVSNFVNHMLVAGIITAGRKGIDQSVFEPLVRETVEKAFELGPLPSQTGPAIRNDINTIEKHIELLSFSDDLRNLYRIITDSIIRHKTQTADE